MPLMLMPVHIAVTDGQVRRVATLERRAVRVALAEEQRPLLAGRAGRQAECWNVAPPIWTAVTLMSLRLMSYRHVCERFTLLNSHRAMFTS